MYSFFPVRSLRSKAILTIFNLIPKALNGKEVAPISSQTKNKDGGNSKPMTSTMEKDIIHCAKYQGSVKNVSTWSTLDGIEG